MATERPSQSSESGQPDIHRRRLKQAYSFVPQDNQRSARWCDISSDVTHPRAWRHASYTLSIALPAAYSIFAGRARSAHPVILFAMFAEGDELLAEGAHPDIDVTPIGGCPISMSRPTPNRERETSAKFRAIFRNTFTFGMDLLGEPHHASRFGPKKG